MYSIFKYCDNVFVLHDCPIRANVTLCPALIGLHGSSGKLTGSTSSLNKLNVQGSNSRRSQSSSLLDMGNMSASDLDVADRTKFDKVLTRTDSRTVRSRVDCVVIISSFADIRTSPQ